MKGDSVLLKRGVFSSLTEEQKICILLYDEICAKNVNILRRNGVWRVTNNPNVIAETRLGIMVNCFQVDQNLFKKGFLKVVKVD